MTETPIFFVPHEPRVRTRWWAPERRARRAAQDAIDAGGTPTKFIVALRAPHERNPFGQIERFFIAHASGVITLFLTTTAGAP